MSLIQYVIYDYAKRKWAGRVFVTSFYLGLLLSLVVMVYSQLDLTSASGKSPLAAIIIAVVTGATMFTLNATTFMLLCLGALLRAALLSSTGAGPQPSRDT